MARGTSSSFRTVVLLLAVSMLAARASAMDPAPSPEAMVERAGEGLERWLAEAQQPTPADPTGDSPLLMPAEHRAKRRGAGRREENSSSSRRRTSTSHHSTSTHASSSHPSSSSATSTATSTSSSSPTSSAAVQQGGASMVQGPPQTSSPATAGTMAGSGGGSTSHTAVIAGAAVGGAAVLGIGAFGALWLKRHSRARSVPKHHQHLSSSSRVLDISAPWDPWPAKKSRAPLRQPPWEPWSARPALEGGETTNASEMRERESELGTANPFADNPFSPVSVRSTHSWGDAQSPMSPDQYDAYPHPGGGPFARRTAVTPDAMV